VHARLEPWLNWEPIGLGPYETVRARLMSKALLLLASVCALSVFPQLAMPGARLVAIVPAGFLATYVVALRQLWGGEQRRAARIVVWSGVLGLATILVPFGGVTGTTPLFMVIGVIVAVMWLSTAEALVVTGAYLVMLAVALAPPLRAVQPVFPADNVVFAMFLSEVMAMVQAGVLVGITVDALSATSVEARLRTAQAQRAREQALKASEAKSAFLAMMSHELRTPLNAILGYAQLLREDGGPGDADLERIERSGSKLLKLVDDVLEMARAESARLGAFEPIDLRALVDEQIAALDVVAAVSAPGAAVTVISERANLRRIVSNLLAHTARSSRLHRVDIVLTADSQMAHLALHERGHTASRAALPSAFEGGARPERTASAGLGMALAQRLAQRLGGWIEVEANERDGSTFTLHLPQQAPGESPAVTP
jgi:signal transduction histidine kinase